MYYENSKIVICLDSFSEQMYNILVTFRLLSVIETTALFNPPIYVHYFPLASFFTDYDDAFIAET